MLALLCVAQLLLVVDVVIVNVALPVMRDSLHIGDTHLQLTSVAYTLVFGSLLVIAGRLGDKWGRRRLLLVGIAVFTVASLLSGAAQIAWHLFAARALQGLGAALVSPNALSLLTGIFPEGDARNRAFGLWAAVGSGGAIVGQVLGGALTHWIGWRWIFYINVPIGLLLLPLLLRHLKESRVGGTGEIDVLGAVALAGSLACLTLALTTMAGGTGGNGFVAFAVGAVALAIYFVSVQGRQQDPLIRFGLFRNRALSLGNAVLAINAGAVAATMFFTTLYLQVQLGQTPLAVGAGFAPVTVIMLVVSLLAGRWIGRFGATRLLVSGGLAAAFGMLYLTRVPAKGTYAVDVLPALALIAVGSGLSYAPTFTLGTTGVRSDEQGLASGLLNTAQELGAAVGLALVAALALTVSGADGGFTAGEVGLYRAGYVAAAVMQAVAVGLAAVVRPVAADAAGREHLSVR